MVVLDGGLATELQARGHDLSDRLWSARLLLTDPDAIEAVHLAYFEAGAQVATTASYQATVPGFAAAGLDRSAALGAIRDSVAIARRARERFAEARSGFAGARASEVDEARGRFAGARGPEVDDLLIAGSVGPYGAMLADGSEYRGDYDPGEATLRDVHGPRIDALLSAGADLLALETIPTMREAEVLVRLVEEAGATAWLSYQCRDSATTAAGESIVSAVQLVDDAPGIVAVGVNCTAPRYIPELLDAAAVATAADAAADLALVAYPNGGDRWDPNARTWVADAGGGFDPAMLAGLVTHRAVWLGGCCGTGPNDIARLVDLLADRRADGAASGG